MKYDIGYTTENKPVAIIDTNILDGVPKNEWVKTIKNNITNKFPEGIPISGRLIKVNRITKNEITNSKYTKYLKSTDGTIYADKLKATNNLDDIILATTNYINEDLKHIRKDNFKEFARGDVLIRVGKNDYTAKVIVGLTNSNNMVLYDIVDFTPTTIKIKENISNRYSLDSEGSDRNDMFSNTKIPQNDDGVNTYSMQDTEKYSLDDESIEYLLDEYKAGNITKQEFLEQVGTEKKETLRDIANLTKEDASSTPPKKPTYY